LTRGRLWIGALATLLVGIVALNVLALSFNAASSRVGRQADTLKREISALRARIATNGASNESVQVGAVELGLAVPAPGSIRYLSLGPDDAAVAAKRLHSGELTSQPSYLPPATTTPTTTAAVAPPADQPVAVIPAPPAVEPAAIAPVPAPPTAGQPPAPAPAPAPQTATATPSGGGGVATP